MKKILITLLIVVIMTSSNCLYVNAGHQHTDKCYEMQGAHTHTGDATSGGACYATPVYHTHTGDTSNGGDCYATPVYHTHSGNATSGGACYATPVYHKHSGSSSSGGGCYTTKNTCGGTINAQEKGTGQIIYADDINGWKSTGTCSTCSQNHSYCRRCGDWYSCSGFKCNGHEKTITEYKCSTCGTSYGATGKCTKVKSYSPGCGKTTSTVEKYNLSCSKSTTKAESYKLSCSKTAETVESYDLSCIKTAETIEGYDLSCIKTAETVDSYDLSCTKKESAGEKVLICKQQESVESDKTETKPTTPNVPVQVPNIPSPAPAPTPTPEQSTPTPAPAPTPEQSTPAPETKEPVKEVVKEEPQKETKEPEVVEEVFDFRVECNLISDGALVKIIPLSMDNLADVPYSWDNGISWNKSDESIFAKNGTYYIAIKNKEGKIKAKKLDIDFTITNFAVITDYAATLSEIEFKEMTKTVEEPVMEVVEDTPEEKSTEKKSGGKIALAIGVITIFVAGIGGAGFFLVKKLLLGSGGIVGGGTGGAAKVIDSASGKSLGKCQIKKKNGEVVSFETKINDKAIIFVEDGFTIIPPKKLADKYIGYNLLVKTSQGNFEAEIAETIEIDF